MAWRADQDQEGHEEESFFVSMSDIMVGLLFIFIILVVFFVLQIRIEASKVVELEAELNLEQGETSQRDQLDKYRSRTADQRTEILKGLQSFFAKEGSQKLKSIPQTVSSAFRMGFCLRADSTSSKKALALMQLYRR